MGASVDGEVEREGHQKIQTCHFQDGVSKNFSVLVLSWSCYSNVLVKAAAEGVTVQQCICRAESANQSHLTAHMR